MITDDLKTCLPIWNLIRICHPPNDTTSPEYKVLHFLTTIIYFPKSRTHKLSTFYKCCQLVLYLRLIIFNLFASLVSYAILSEQQNGLTCCFVSSRSTAKNSERTTWWPPHKTLFSSSGTLRQNKLECLPLSSFLRLVYYLQAWLREWGKYHWTVDLFDWFGISCMTTDSFCFYLWNRLIQTSKTGAQWYTDTSPFSIPCLSLPEWST